MSNTHIQGRSATVDGMALAFADKHTNVRYSVGGKHFWIKFPHNEIPENVRVFFPALSDGLGQWVRDERNIVFGMMRTFAREYAALHPDVPDRVILNSRFINGAVSLLKADERVAISVPGDLVR